MGGPFCTIFEKLDGANFQGQIVLDNLKDTYRLKATDLNGDKKMDILLLVDGNLHWYKNTSEKEAPSIKPLQEQRN